MSKNRKQRRAEKNLKGTDRALPVIGEIFSQALRYHQAGQLKEAEQLYRQVLMIDSHHADTLHLLGVLARQIGRPDLGVELIQQAIAIMGNVPLFYNNLGTALQDQGKLNEALAQYKIAAAFDPNYADAHYNIGNIYKEQWQLDEAVVSYERAIAIKPDHANAHNNLGVALRGLGKLAQAAGSYEHAISIQPHYTEARGNLGNVLKDQGKLDEALQVYERSYLSDPDNAEIHYNEGLARLLAGDFEIGWSKYEWRFKLKDAKQILLSGPAWDGADLHGKTILLHCEQGLGDSIQFIRYAPLLKEKGATISLFCPPSLAHLFNKDSGIDSLYTEISEIPAYDFQLPLLSLPRVFATRLTNIPATIPYLHPEAYKVAVWRERLRDLAGLKIGIAWRGNPTHTNDHNRSMIPQDFSPILSIQGIAVINLQHDARAEEITELDIQGDFLNAAPDLYDFADTAALLTNLDLVISVDTSICHLAGALGIPVWNLIPYSPDWRWLLKRDDSPWYPTMRLFRQSQPKQWGAVIDNVKRALQHKIHSDENLVVQ